MDRNYKIYKPPLHAYLAFGVWRNSGWCVTGMKGEFF